MKVLLVDKHPMVRAHLRQLLAAFPRIEISEAADVHEGLALARNRRPTLILVDLEVSDLGGVKLLRSIHIENPDARVVMLSGRAEPILAARAMCAGAAGYVRKTASSQELLQTVRRVAEGRRYIEAEIAQLLALQVVDALAGQSAQIGSLRR